MENNKKGMNPFAILAVGAALGASAVVVATRVLSDKRARQKISDTIDTAKERITDYAHRISAKARNKKEEAEDMLKEGSKAVKKSQTSAKR